MASNAEVLARPVDYIQRVRALAPSFAEAQAHQEANAELDPRLVPKLHAAGLFRMLLPAWLNGAALDPLTYTSVVEEIARYDASAAWCVNQGSGCSMVAATSIRRWRAESSATRRTCSPGGLRPGATAVAVEGGYRLNYKASFASGSRHATSLGAICLVYEADGKPRVRADGRNDLRAFMLPK